MAPDPAEGPAMPRSGTQPADDADRVSDRAAFAPVELVAQPARISLCAA
jgi:hypothetical protein